MCFPLFDLKEARIISKSLTLAFDPAESLCSELT
jgi:hypothetical protein